MKNKVSARWCSFILISLITLASIFSGCKGENNKQPVSEADITEKMVDAGNESPAKKPAVNEVKSLQTANTSDFLEPYIKKAKLHDKKLFLLFSMKGCTWCRKFAKYLADPEVSGIFKTYFITVIVDIDSSEGANNLYKQYWKPGMPSWTILDADRKLIADSENKAGGSGNIGYPHNERDINFFLSSLRTAAPSMGEREAEVLRGKL